MCENGNECFLTIQLSENTRALFCLIDNADNIGKTAMWKFVEKIQRRLFKTEKTLNNN